MDPELLKFNHALSSRNKELEQRNVELEKENIELREKTGGLTRELESIKEQLEALTKRIYGRRSERFESPGQLDLFDALINWPEAPEREDASGAE